MFADPLFPPKQFTLEVVILLKICEGCVIKGLATVTEQPLAEVTFKEYEPAGIPVAVAVIPPPGDHEYENGPVPELTVAVMAPFVPPKQLTLVRDETETSGAGLSPTVWLAAALQLLASVTVTV